MMNYLILFSISFLAATVLPFSSEAVLAALVIREQAILIPVLVASLGNIGGSLTTFWLGWRGGTWAESRTERMRKRIERARLWLERWGPPILFLGWVPLVGDLLVAGAGILRLNVKACVFWISLGKVVRYLIIAWSAHSLVA